MEFRAFGSATEMWFGAFVDAVRAVSHLANILAQPEMRELCEEGSWMALYTTVIYEPWNKVGEEAYSGDCES